MEQPSELTFGWIRIPANAKTSATASAAGVIAWRKKKTNPHRNDPAAFAEFPLGLHQHAQRAPLCPYGRHRRNLDVKIKGSFKEGVRSTTTIATVGDRVHVERYPEGEGLIVGIVPRVTMLSRPDPFQPHLQDIIVANINQLVIAASVGDLFWHELVDRYLVYAEYYKIEPLIVVNKVDLASSKEIDSITALYRDQLGYRVLFTSIVTGEGVQELRDLMGPRGTWSRVFRGLEIQPAQRPCRKG